MADGKVEIEVELDAKGAKSSADKMGKQIGDALDNGVEPGAKSMGNSIAGFAKKAAGALAAVGIADKLKDIGVSAVNAAAEVSAETASFEQIMGDYAGEAQKKMQAVADATGMTDTRLTSAMTSMTAKFKGLGFGVEEATDLATRGLTLSADAAAFWDKSLEDAQGSLNSFINGNYEGGEAIGLFANDTQMAQFAIQQGIVQSTKDWAALDEATKQATRLEYAENMFALSGATGQAAKEQDQYANVTANAQEAWRQFLAVIGEPIMDNVVVPALENGGNALKAMSDEVKNGMPSFQGLFSAFESLSPILAGAAAGFAAFKAAMAISSTITAVTTAMSAFKAAQEASTIAQALLNAVMNANPFVLIVTVIAAVVAALVMLWTTNEGFREAVMSAWEAISSAAASVWGAVVNFFTVVIPQAIASLIGWFMQLPGMIGSALSSALAFIGSFVSGAVSNAIKAGSGFLSGIASFFGQLPSNLAGFVAGAVSSLAAFVSGAISNAIQAGSGFLNGVSSGFGSAVEFVRGIPGRILGALGDLGSLLIDSGRSMLNGLAEGIRQGISNAIGAVQQGLSDIRSFFPFSPAKRGPFSGRGYTTYSGRALMRDLGKGMDEGAAMAAKAANEALARVQASFAVPVDSAMMFAGAMASGSSGDVVTNTTDARQTINFNMPVRSPDEVARAMRMQARYGLAGAR